MSKYHYTESGIDNVYIEGMKVQIDDHDDEVYCIPNVNGLHKVIAHAIVNQAMAMLGTELRFLRTEMGVTQAELAKLVHRDAQTMGRWERGEIEIDSNAEVLIRLVACEKLGLDPGLSVEEMAQRCVPSAKLEVIRIDGSNPSNYQQIAA